MDLNAAPRSFSLLAKPPPNCTPAEIHPKPRNSLIINYQGGMKNLPRFQTIVLLLAVLFFPWGGDARAYSLLTHEQLIDLTWQDSIVPLLLSRYPNLTPAQLDEARAYAYGGCVIQDIGYYPFGDAVFLQPHPLHALAAILSSTSSAMQRMPTSWPSPSARSPTTSATPSATPQATNRAVPVEFPKLGAQYGPVVNYAEGQHQHVQTEFAFDIDQIAHHRLAPLHYLRHIGLRVPVQQLSDSFYQTYGMSENFRQAGHHRQRQSLSLRHARFHSAHCLCGHPPASQSRARGPRHARSP